MIRYDAGNYEAFVRPRKPKGVEDRKAYIVGSGLAGLTAAICLVRDAGMPGENRLFGGLCGYPLQEM